MKTISLREETWQRLQALGEPLVDTADSVIVRLIENYTVSDISDPTSSDTASDRRDPKDKFNEVLFRKECVEKVRNELRLDSLNRRNRTFFVHEPSGTAVTCLVSRKYDITAEPQFWFGFQERRLKDLEVFERGYLTLGCGTSKTVFLVPVTDLTEWLDDMNRTEKPGSSYWHVHIHHTGGRFELRLKEGRTPIDLTKYLLKPSI